MDSTIGLPIVIGSAFVISGLFFWCTYRYQVEPTGGRKTEDQINAIYAAKIRQEIELAHKENSDQEDNEDAKSEIASKTI